jgi:hypothetical protein
MLSLMTFDFATSGVLGWHITIPYTLNWNPIFCTVFFLAVAVVYGFLPKGKLSVWYFWLHASLSILPLLYNLVRFSPLLFDRSKINTSLLMQEINVLNWLNYIFIANQILFVFVLLGLQYSDRKQNMRTTSDF